jgi:hypothetical protein
MSRLHFDFLVPEIWVTLAFDVPAAFMFAMGLLAAVLPESAIRGYQKAMNFFNWTAVPLDPAREIRSTRLLGFLLMIVAAAIPWMLRVSLSGVPEIDVPVGL